MHDRAPRGLPLRILGTGVHEPSVRVTSADLDARYSRDPGTSFARSGVDSRRWAASEETSSSMAAAAITAAMTASGIDADHLDAIIVSAVAPEQPMPTTAVLTAARLGVPGGRCEAFDVNASCVGFLTALNLAAANIACGRWRTAAVVATELASRGLDHDDVETSSLFGDGAAAVIVTAPEPGQDSAILGSRAAVWPQVAAACRIDAGGTRWNPVSPPPDPSAYLFAMDGFTLLRETAKQLPGFLTEFETDTGIAIADVDVVIPHQASGVGLRYLKERVVARPDAVIDILADHGNQVSASIPTALHAAVDSGKLTRGGTALLLGTGAGLAVSTVMLRY